MTPSREDLEHYVSGSFEGDVAAFERAIGEDPKLAAQLAEEAELEMLLREAGAAATFCPACDELVRDARCAACGAARRPGGYVVERLLVANAHGRMYVARDADGKRVALKELAFVHAPSAAATEAFDREAKLLRALDHAAIPRFVASFEEGEGVHARYYLAQELVDGTPLDAGLEQHFYREDEIRELARDVLGVLVYLQSLSPMVIHRDVKPANLVKRADGSIALVDFGAAHVAGATRGSTTIGTFGYMPVEQLAGIVDATTDVYALGASLIHLLTRQEPWKILQAPELAMNVSGQLRAWLAKATHADPKQRFASAKDALDALDARAAVPRQRMSKRTLVASAIAVGTFALGGGAFAVVHALETPSEKASPPAVPEPSFAKVRPVAPPTISLPSVERLPRGATLDFSFKAADLHDVLRTFGQKCGWNVIVPDSIDAQVMLELRHVPCDQALEVLLEAHGLWYEYRSDGKLVRIAPRKELDREREEAMVRAQNRALLGETPGAPPTPSPSGEVDLDFKDAPLPDLLRIFAASGHVNLVMDESIDGRVTVMAHHVAWRPALEEVLAAHGLWYRFRADGNILRISPRKQLDREDEAELVRRQNK